MAAIKRQEATISIMKKTVVHGTMTPNWSNFLEWLREFHKGTISRQLSEPYKFRNSGLDIAVASGMFQTCIRMLSHRWEEVEELMHQWRVILVKIDVRWNS